jgi:hypothetical protein
LYLNHFYTPLSTARAVFRPNETHHQQDIFGIETQLSPELWKRLRESKEYAFYKEVFCRIPGEVFAELYSAGTSAPQSHLCFSRARLTALSLAA